jgi:hypothetical protein
MSETKVLILSEREERMFRRIDTTLRNTIPTDALLSDDEIDEINYRLIEALREVQ